LATEPSSSQPLIANSQKLPPVMSPDSGGDQVWAKEPLQFYGDIVENFLRCNSYSEENYWCWPEGRQDLPLGEKPTVGKKRGRRATEAANKKTDCSGGHLSTRFRGMPWARKGIVMTECPETIGMAKKPNPTASQYVVRERREINLCWERGRRLRTVAATYDSIRKDISC